MSRLWNKPGVPHKGWRCVGAVDLDWESHDHYVRATCQMCGQERIRYVHTMEHDDYPRRLRVGFVCAAKMDCDPGAPRAREQRLINLAGRRTRWRMRDWNRSRRGNEWLKVEDCTVTAFPSTYNPGAYCYSIKRTVGSLHFSQGTYASAYEAKLAAFDDLAKKLGW